MRVRDLIGELQKYHPDSDVNIAVNGAALRTMLESLDITNVVAVPVRHCRSRPPLKGGHIVHRDFAVADNDVLPYLVLTSELGG